MLEKSKTQQKTIFKSLQGWKISIPIVIGILAVFILFWDEFNYQELTQIPFSKYAIVWFIAAISMMLLRDFGYIVRIKVLTGNSLTWKQCIRIVFLWEFTSAITPSAVGGTAFAVIYLYKEKISLGKSSAVVMLTSFLDEMYFLIMFPVIILSVNFNELFEIQNLSNTGGAWTDSFMYFAVVGYSLKAAFVIIVGYGLFINPQGLKRVLVKIFTLSFLKKWQHKIEKLGADIVLASNEFKGKPFSFWVKAILSTFISWTSRYWVVNFLFLAYFVVHNHFVIFARQLIMWIMMLVLPSPGGAGFSEYLFKEYLGEYIPYVTLIGVLAFLWRVATYYPYLLIGAFLLPSWIKKKFS